MPAFDLEDDDNFALSYFDECKLEDMDVKDTVEGECGNFVVKRVSKTQYNLFLRNEGLIRKYQTLQMSFKTLGQLLKFLKR